MKRSLSESDPVSSGNAARSWGHTIAPGSRRFGTALHRDGLPKLNSVQTFVSSRDGSILWAHTPPAVQGQANHAAHDEQAGTRLRHARANDESGRARGAATATGQLPTGRTDEVNAIGDVEETVDVPIRARGA